MLKVSGKRDTPEYAAARQLREAILKSLPSVESNLDDTITMVTGAQCHGQRFRDIDLLVLAHFNSQVRFSPFLSFPNPWNPSELERPASVSVQNLCLVIEVKDHSADRVQFRGKDVRVRYRGRWHDASYQNAQQMYSLKNYLAIHNLRSPYITHLIWLRNLHNSELPPRPHNILAGNLTWEMLLNVVAQLNPPHLKESKWFLSTSNLNVDAIDHMEELFTKEMTPTRLDRRRMEQISEQLISKQRLYDRVGDQMLILRGRGGTGKTVRLLQLAKHLYEQEGARILILTYNKALVADLRRLLTLMGVVDEAAKRSIRVQTVHSFFYSVLSNLGLLDEDRDDFLERYEELKLETVQMLEVGALFDSDLEQLKNSSKAEFLWDYLFVDEGQDWPEDEQRILLELYPSSHFVIADGIDQLIRSRTPANWRSTLSSTQVSILSLDRCLRMKAGLTRFVSTLASYLGLPQTEWKANKELPGGKIVIVEGSGFPDDRGFFDKLIKANEEAGNRPVDMLFTVPPGLASANRIKRVPASIFANWGYQVWDGAKRDVRNTYPTDVDQLRIVQYDSCRGLEGWTVVNFDLNAFYEYKLNQLRLWSEINPDAVLRDHDAIRLRAARWLLIPLTRAMDTLVIHLSSSSTEVAEAIQRTAEKHIEFVEWIEI